MFKIDHNLKGLIRIFLFMLISTITFGQTENDPGKFVPNIIPPSPTAYGLGTYGNTPVGLFTGSQNINIPIYTYKTANLEVPISMFYSSNGVKVDEISSNVGQSWNLSFGGVITRVVRDKPDEDRGEYPIPISITEAMGRYSPPALQFYQYIGENDVDTEADLFSFNFGKYSGKFVFDNDGSVLFMPAQELQIERNLTPEGFNFTVTTPDGVKYYFNDKEITSQRVVGSGHSIPNIGVSSWYLSKIVHPKGDVIQFIYDDEVTNYIASKSQTFRMLSPRIQYDLAGNLESFAPSLSSICDHTIALNGKSIKSIKSTNTEYGEIVFTSRYETSADVTTGNRKLDKIVVKDKSGKEIENIGFTYTTTSNKRVFLDKIQFKDINQNYSFEYDDRVSLPARLSYSQDHWGYFNGKTNYNIVPKGVSVYELGDVNYNGADKEPDGSYAGKGLLNKIIYPTKGYTTFSYESNTYYGTRMVYPPKIYKSLSAVTNDTLRNLSKELRFINPMKQNIPLVAGVSFYAPPGVEDNENRSQAYVGVYDLTLQQYVPLKRSDNGGIVTSGSTYTITPNTAAAAKSLVFSAELNHEYRITLTVPSRYTSSSINFNYYPSGLIEEPANILTGGMRVSQTNDFSVNKENPVRKIFMYTKRNESKSSGNKGQEPYYLDRFRVDRAMEGTFAVTSKTMINLSSSSLTSLFDTGNSNVYYQYVTISYDYNFQNGGEEHEFIVHRDGGGGFIVGNHDIRNTPLSNLGWDNGLLKKVTYFNRNKKIVKEITNEYEEREDLRKESISYNARKNYEKIAFGSVVYDCTEEDLTKRTPYRTCVADHKHLKFTNSLFGSPWVCVAPGHDNRTIYFPHPCYGETVGKQIIKLDNIDNLSIVSYSNFSFWHYLKSTQETIYDINGENPVSTITDYNYRGINHIQLSSQSSNSSNKEKIETKYFYAKDDEMAGEPFVNDLKTANMIGIPLDTQNFRNGIKVSEQKNSYEKNVSTADLLLPKYVYNNKGALNVTGTDKRITFDQYDDKGNILQYTLEGNTPTAIIWGYNKTKPIARIENAHYSDAAGYISNLQTKSNTGTEADLITNLDSLRNALPNAMVTTYTYLPLIGISTITDPKGNRTTYSYDEFNRLKTVKDGQGHIVSENQYHYKN